MFSPQLWFILVTPSVFKDRGVVIEYVCSYAGMWADMAICHSPPLGSTSGRPRCRQLGINIVKIDRLSDLR